MNALDCMRLQQGNKEKTTWPRPFSGVSFGLDINSIYSSTLSNAIFCGYVMCIFYCTQIISYLELRAESLDIFPTCFRGYVASCLLACFLV